MAPPSRKLPNIIITGTPGVGKTTHAEQVAERTGLKHISVNEIVKDKECHEGWDDEYQSWIVDEDKVRYSVSFHYISYILFLSLALSLSLSQPLFYYFCFYFHAQLLLQLSFVPWTRMNRKSKKKGLGGEEKEQTRYRDQ